MDFPQQQGYAGWGEQLLMNEQAVLFISADNEAVAKVESALKGGNPGVLPALELVRVDALLDGLRHLQERSFDLILSDLYLPDGQGLATLRHLQQHAPNTPMIALCHAQDRETGVTAVRKGAYDFFCYEDFDPGNLRKSMESAMDYALAEEEQKQAGERRVSARFPCRLAVTYQSLEHPIISGHGSSETLNISSKGLLFTSNEQFRTGQLIQVSLDWPARLENQVPLKLVAEGRIVRNADGQTAMTIEKYEFRTRRVSTGSTAAKPANSNGPKSSGTKTSSSGTSTTAGANTKLNTSRRPN
jgi:DNA-binding NarL/FixJ family response regulator